LVPLMLPSLAGGQQGPNQYFNLDWMHLTKAPAKLDEWRTGNNVVIYASDIDLGNVSYNGGGGNLTLIADVLRVTDSADFAADAYFRPADPFHPSGSVLIVARRIVIGEDGVLGLLAGTRGTLTVIGQVSYEPLTKPIELTGRYKFLKSYRPTDYETILKTMDLSGGEVAGGYSGVTVNGKTSYTLSRLMDWAALRGAVWFKSEARREVNTSPPFPESFFPHPDPKLITISTKIPDAQKYAPTDALSLWTVMALEHAVNIIQTAALADDRETELAQFQKVPIIASQGFAVANAHAERYAHAANLLSQLRTQLLPPVYRGSITVQPSVGIPTVLTRFVENGSLQSWIAPTEALVSAREIGGKHVLGFVQRDSQANDRIRLVFDADLGLDPALSVLVSKQLEQTGQTVAGMFSNWKLTAPNLSAEGIDNFEVKVLNNTLQISLTLDAAEGNVALWRLGTGLGLPLTLQYECTANTSIKGSLSLPLSLARRSRPDIEVSNGSVANTGRTAVTIDYFMLGDSPVSIQPLTIPADNKPVKLPLPDGTDLSKTALKVPAQAVWYSGRDPFSLQDFDTTQSGGLIQTIQVQNLLPALNAKLNLPLDYVQVSVIYTVGEGDQAVEAKAGPYRLSAAGSDDSEVNVPFLRPSTGKYSFRVEGIAFYDKRRSSFRLKSDPTNEATILIDEKLFQQ